MRILDENDNEIQEEDIDSAKGELVLDRIFVKHHDAIPYQAEESHYEVKAIYFLNGDPLYPENNNDPHILQMDAKAGIFEYADQGEGRTCVGMNVLNIIDVQQQDPQEAWDEYEEIQRYVLYTGEEQQKKEAEVAEQEAIKALPEKMDELELSLDEITLLLADMIAG